MAAAESAERAQAIAARHQKYADELRDLLLPTPAAAKISDFSDPLPRLEWLGVQRFAAGDNPSACDFFARARELVLLRRRRGEGGCSAAAGRGADADGRGGGLDAKARVGGREPANTEGLLSRGSKRKPDKAPGTDAKAGAGRRADVGPGEFHPDAMRLDRCIAVSICRRGPEAF